MPPNSLWLGRFVTNFATFIVNLHQSNKLWSSVSTLIKQNADHEYTLLITINELLSGVITSETIGFNGYCD